MNLFFILIFLITGYFYFFSNKLKPVTVATFRFVSIFIAGISFLNAFIQIEEFGGKLSNIHYGNWVPWIILGIFTIRTFIVIKEDSIAKNSKTNVEMNTAANVMMVPIFAVIFLFCSVILFFALLTSGIMKL